MEFKMMTMFERLDATSKARSGFGMLGEYDEATRSVPVILSTPAFVEVPDDRGLKIRESLKSFDLSRFEKNPVVMMDHCTTGFPYGLAKELEQTPEGLKGRVFFASEEANPQVKQLIAAVKEKLIRAVSVQFDPGPITSASIGADGVPEVTREDNLLIELSFCAIGKDEDAGTPAINPDAARQRAEGSSPEDMDENAQSQWARPRASGTVGDPTRVEEPAVSKPAGAPEEDEEETRKRISEGARQMALARHRKRAVTMTRTDAAEVWKHLSAKGWALRMDRQLLRFDKFEETPSGGRRIPARLTRTGVLTYRNPDGSTRNELRLPEEVFKADSMSTLNIAPVIDIKDHTGMVTPDTWKRAQLGVVHGPKRDGQYVAANLDINDRPTLDAVANGERIEISCGYQCRLEPAPPGMVFEGKPVDFIQRNITYNHAALCPPNRGRAGPDVGLRLDTGSPIWGVSDIEGEENMATNENKIVLVRIDGKDYTHGSSEHITKIEETHAAALTQVKLDAKKEVEAQLGELQTKLDAETKRADTAQGRADGLEETLKTVRTDFDNFKKEKEGEGGGEGGGNEKQEAQRKVMRARRRLERAVLQYRTIRKRMRQQEMESDEDQDEMDDEEKMDAKLDSLSDRDLMLLILTDAQPKFDAKDKSDAYVEARFDSLMEQVKSSNTIEKVVGVAKKGAEELSTNFDAGDEDPVTKARKSHDQRMAGAWKAGQGNGDNKDGGK